jgi:hypothetical protein
MVDRHGGDLDVEGPELLEVETTLAIYAKARPLGVAHVSPFTDVESMQMQSMSFDLDDFG